MPTLEVLDRLKNQINQLGDEPRKLAASGEVLEDVIASQPQPGQVLDDISVDDSGDGVDEMNALLDSYTADLGGLDLEESGDSTFESFDAPSVSDTADLGGLDLEESGDSTFESFDAPSVSDTPDLGGFDLGESGDIDDDAQEFSIEDFGDQYGFAQNDSRVIEDEAAEMDEQNPLSDKAKPFSISEKDFQALQQTLSKQPRNLQIAIEKLLASNDYDIAKLMPLINALIDGESSTILVKRYRSITQLQIPLPRNYRKRSGRAFEELRESSVYRMTHEGGLILRNIFLVISAVWFLGFVAFMWIYRPIKAEQIYSKGLAAIMVDDVDAAVEFFHDAWDGWPLFAPKGDRIADASIVVKGWKSDKKWLDYARAFRRRKYWDLSRRFHESYLDLHPESKDVWLEYASFLSGVLGEYAEAINVLEKASPKDGQWDREYVLATGDVYLDWAEDDPTNYENARLFYAEVLEKSRNDERALLSMMRYHLRIQNEKEIQTLLPVFQKEIPGKTSEPVLAAEVYADIADYYLRRGNNSASRKFIELAENAYSDAPDPFFVKAQYWRTVGDEQSELEAYQRTLLNLDGWETLERDHLRMRILSFGGIGRIYANKVEQFQENLAVAREMREQALAYYGKAVNLYEDARLRNQLGIIPEYGLLYLDLGDIMYRGDGNSDDLKFSLAPNFEIFDAVGDRMLELQRAEEFYNQAEEVFSQNGAYTGLSPEALYHRAYVRYFLQDPQALADFYRVVRQRPEDYESRIALATALLEAGDYEASRSQYARSIELMDGFLLHNGGRLEPLHRGGHQDLLLRYIAAYNNLGVARALSAMRGNDAYDYAAALSALTMASDYQDKVSTSMDGISLLGATELRDSEDRRIVDISGGRNLIAEETTFPYRNRLRLLGLETSTAESDQYLIYPDIPSDLLSP